MSVKYFLKILKKFSLIFVVLFFLFWPTILGGVFPPEMNKELPSLLNIFPGVVGWILLIKIRCPYSRLLGYFWLLWYFVGTCNTIASSIILGSYYSNLDLHESTQIYLWGSVFYFLGLLIYEKIFAKNKINIYGLKALQLNISPSLRFVLLVFPFAWLGSIYLTLGYIPILRGVNIVNEMYQVNYGLLYPYGALIVISILYSVYRFMISSIVREKLFFLFISIIFALISTADGKRGFAMVAVGGAIGLSFRVVHQKTWTKVIPSLSFLVVVLYVGVLLVRLGDNGSSVASLYANMMLIGVEFRDFVYTVNNYKPGGIVDYSWAASSFASMVNGGVVALFGFNKADLTALDSAHAWSALWDIELGIRTGIISELWFAYGFAAMPLLLFFGLITGFVIRRLRVAAGIRELLFISAIYGLLMLIVNGQSTFTFGVLPVFLYFYIALCVGGYLLKKHRWPQVQLA